jgi:hypothetical protein
MLYHRFIVTFLMGDWLGPKATHFKSCTTMHALSYLLCSYVNQRIRSSSILNSENRICTIYLILYTHLPSHLLLFTGHDWLEFAPRFRIITLYRTKATKPSLYKWLRLAILRNHPI